MEVGGPFSPAPPMRELNFSREDRHILTKHQEILPVDNELRTLLKLVQMAEECLAKACRELNQVDYNAQKIDVKLPYSFIPLGRREVACQSEPP